MAKRADFEEPMDMNQYPQLPRSRPTLNGYGIASVAILLAGFLTSVFIVFNYSPANFQQEKREENTELKILLEKSYVVRKRGVWEDPSLKNKVVVWSVIENSGKLNPAPLNYTSFYYYYSLNVSVVNMGRKPLKIIGGELSLTSTNYFSKPFFAATVLDESCGLLNKEILPQRSISGEIEFVSDKWMEYVTKIVTKKRKEFVYGIGHTEYDEEFRVLEDGAEWKLVLIDEKGGSHTTLHKF